jgi:hypothetical protein
MAERILYSFVVDEHPKYAYQGWHLARSIIQHCGATPGDIAVQATPRVAPHIKDMFAAEGYSVRALDYFGDGKWCNKLAQLPNLLNDECHRVVLLDTDMIMVSDVRPFLQGDAVQAKIVDGPNPPLATLAEIFTQAGGCAPPTVPTDAGDAATVIGNANGGFYAVPQHLAARFSAEWRKWAQFLLAHDDSLRQAGKTSHVDQVSAALAFNLGGIPFTPAPSNVNYFIHYQAARRYFDATRPISIIHYHDSTLSMDGTIAPATDLSPMERSAIATANEQIRNGFHNALFWDFRYATHPERGSGLGSRGEHLLTKRALLKQHGLEDFASVLDVGCGDLHVLGGLNLKGYVGIDVSAAAVERARALRPDWEFAVNTGQPIAPHEAVVCLDVLIHQRDAEAYHALVKFLADHTEKTLFVSGYEHKEDATNLVFFHESLSKSLAATKRFASIQRIGALRDVQIFRCDTNDR